MSEKDSQSINKEMYKKAFNDLALLLLEQYRKKKQSEQIEQKIDK